MLIVSAAVTFGSFSSSCPRFSQRTITARRNRHGLFCFCSHIVTVWTGEMERLSGWMNGCPRAGETSGGPGRSATPPMAAPLCCAKKSQGRNQTGSGPLWTPPTTTTKTSLYKFQWRLHIPLWAVWPQKARDTSRNQLYGRVYVYKDFKVRLTSIK